MPSNIAELKRMRALVVKANKFEQHEKIKVPDNLLSWFRNHVENNVQTNAVYVDRVRIRFSFEDSFVMGCMFPYRDFPQGRGALLREAVNVLAAEYTKQGFTAEVTGIDSFDPVWFPGFMLEISGWA